MASPGYSAGGGTSIAASQRTNHYRLFRLITEGGTEALRNIFDSIHSTVDLQSSLRRFETNLRRLRPKIINNEQWNLLYPPFASQVTSAQFDISLLVVLLRNICQLKQPKSGWDKRPPDFDHSLEADIARLKYYRNKIAHNTSSKVEDTYFMNVWREVGDALERRGVSREDIDRMKDESIDAELEQRYEEEIKRLVLGGQETAQKIDRLDEKLDKLLQIQDTTSCDLISYESTANNSLLRPTTCSKHEGYVVDKFCRKCKEPVCYKCTKILHPSNEHCVAELHQYASHLRENVEKTLQEMQVKEGEINDSVEIGNDYLSMLTQHYEEQTALVNRTADEQIALIKVKIESMKSNLLDQLSRYYKKQTEVVNAEMERLRECDQTLKKTIEKVVDLLQKGDVMSLVLASEEVADSDTNLTRGSCTFVSRCDKVAEFCTGELNFHGSLGKLMFPAVPCASYFDGPLPKTIKAGTKMNIKICTHSVQRTNTKRSHKSGNAEDCEKGDITDCADVEMVFRNSSGESRKHKFSNRLGKGRYTHGILFSKPGRYSLAVTVRKHDIRGSPHIFDVTSWNERDIGVNLGLGSSRSVRALAVDGHGNVVVATSQTIHVVSEDSKIVREFDTQVPSSHVISDIALSACGTYFVTVEDRARLTSLRDKSSLLEYSKKGNKFRSCVFTYRVRSIAISGDMAYLLSKNNTIAYISVAPHNFGDKTSESYTCSETSKLTALAVLGDKTPVVSSCKDNRVLAITEKDTDNAERLLSLDFKCPRGVAMDTRNRIYVCDSGNNRIAVFNSKFSKIDFIDLSRFGWNKPDKIAVIAGDPCKLVFTVNDNQAIKVLTYT